jgi:hypothetical protein
MGADQHATDLVEIRTGWEPVTLAIGFAICGAAVFACLHTNFDNTIVVVAAAFGGTLAASFGGLVALWFGAELSRRWSWLFGLSLGWCVTLPLLLGGFPIWLALVVGLTAGLVLGALLVRRLAGFARRARVPSVAGAYLGPLMAAVGVFLLLGDAEGAGLLLVIAVPLAIPYGAVVGALLRAER